MTELQPLAPVPATTEIVLPGTGEIVDVSKPDQAAHALDEIDRMRYGISALRDYVVGFLVEESIRRGKKTLRFDGLRFDIVVTHGTEKVYDVAKVRELLKQAGCPDDRMAELIKVDYSVDGNVANQLAAANTRYAAALAGAREEKPIKARARVVR